MPECKYFTTKIKLILTVKKSWNFRSYMEIQQKTHRIISYSLEKKYIGNKAYFCLSPNFCSNTACSFLSTATKPSGSFLTNQP